MRRRLHGRCGRRLLGRRRPRPAPVRGRLTAGAEQGEARLGGGLVPGRAAVLEPDREQMLLAQAQDHRGEVDRLLLGDRAHVQDHRGRPEEVRGVGDLVEQQGEEIGVVRGQQPQRQDRLQRAADLER